MGVDFAASQRSTVGIEWELQLIDKDTLDLRQSADAVLQAVRAKYGESEHIVQEMLLNTIEVTSRPHPTVGECGLDLADFITKVRPITDPLRIELATAGSHPFARPLYQRVTESDRYAELVKRTGYWGRQMLLYGIHVHVGVEDRDKVLPLIRALLTRFAHLQSLSASSPFWAGDDTGYASNRAMVFKQLPTAGVPRQFEHWSEYEHYLADMLHTGVIDKVDEIRWDIRPAPRLGTIEFRVCDAASNLRETLALSALIHCLVEDFSSRLDTGETLPVIPDWFVDENKWRSARYGMDAILILDDEGNEELITDTVEQMLIDLAPTANRLGCSEQLSWVGDILKLGASYQRQRTVAENHGGSLEAVAQYLVEEMKADRPIPADEFTFQRQPEPLIVRTDATGGSLN
ncbi:glutamate--cysteine ligase [Bowdeniella nasicola]|uniref:Putative glutamate--cysteine ligase 2 n=1 Tax=Bowdeniella nasicola TaxID=208480 RepID=A0A1Q5Q3L9_9ACTO|nr:glutamate--cysteine ligase [Bowdeniella nasicola]OKL54401.1 glutamate--cysteine ligase [Bowdeniella nasicola]